MSELSREEQARRWWRPQPHWPADCPCEECSPNSWRNVHGRALEAALSSSEKRAADAERERDDMRETTTEHKPDCTGWEDCACFPSRVDRLRDAVRAWADRYLVGKGYVTARLYEILDARAATPAPEAPRATREEIEPLRLAYAHACERMGMAHANGTRAEWEAAAAEEVTTRAALLSAIDPASPAPAEERPATPAAWMAGGAFCDCGLVEFTVPSVPMARTHDRSAGPVKLHTPTRCRNATPEEMANLASSSAPSPEDTGATAPRKETCKRCRGRGWWTPLSSPEMRIPCDCRASAPGSPSPAAPGSDEGGTR